jgi:hypothetical protein
MRNERVHPLLLIGLLSLGAATVLGWLVCPDLPTDVLEGFFDGLGVATIFGYLLARRTGRLRSLS